MTTINKLKNLNIQFLDSLFEIFNVKKCKNWEELKNNITLNKISLAYYTYKEIFNSNLNRYDLLPKNDQNKLVAIFHGDLDYRTIINNVARYSIYNDEIIVFHKIQNPLLISEEFNPIAKPDLWRIEFANCLYYYVVLNQWVRKGLVHLIENPLNFDESGETLLREQTELRLSKDEDLLLNSKEIGEFVDKSTYDKLKTAILSYPVENIEILVRETFPNYNNRQVQSLAKRFKELGKQNPLCIDVGENNFNNRTLMFNNKGGTIEEVDTICKITGANSYTTEKHIKFQLELRGDNSFWTKFGNLYSNLPLKYLDKTDTSFALQIREEERLSSLRNCLRELFGYINNKDLNQMRDEDILNFNDKFCAEIQRSESEWQTILDEEKKKNIMVIGSSSSIGLFIDPTKIMAPLVATASSILINGFIKNRKLKNYRKKDPISIYVDLKNNTPSFFSDLKNCLL